MIGLLKLVLSYQFIIGFILGAGGLYIYLVSIGNPISFKKVKK